MHAIANRIGISPGVFSGGAPTIQIQSLQSNPDARIICLGLSRCRCHPSAFHLHSLVSEVGHPVWCASPITKHILAPLIRCCSCCIQEAAGNVLVCERQATESCPSMQTIHYCSKLGDLFQKLSSSTFWLHNRVIQGRNKPFAPSCPHRLKMSHLH